MSSSIGDGGQGEGICSHHLIIKLLSLKPTKVDKEGAHQFTMLTLITVHCLQHTASA